MTKIKIPLDVTKVYLYGGCCGRYKVLVWNRLNDLWTDPYGGETFKTVESAVRYYCATDVNW